jgi:hypothetical protein
MAGLALAVFWIHTLVIAGAAWLDLRDLLRLRRALRPLARPYEGALGLVRATVIRGAGPEGALARNVVEQIGRGKGDGKVHFNDADHRSEVYGGAVELDGPAGGGTIIELGELEAMVWPDLRARASAAAPSSSEAITAAEPAARRAKGFRREVEVTLAPRQQVWIAGCLREAEEDAETGAEIWRLEAPEGGPALVSAIEPRTWLSRKAWLVVGFIVAELAIAAGCTVLALWPPLFDWVSMIGAGAALGFFLGVQPIGVSLNEAVRTPNRAYLRGCWTRR